MSGPFNPYPGPFRSGPSSRGGGPWPPEDIRGPPPGVPPARGPPPDLWEYERNPKRPAPAGYGGPSPAGGARPGKPMDEPVNDCEIIAVGNPDPKYVQVVENGIRDFNLKVDVMIPSPTAKISSFIENLAQRGTIFAVVIRPENEVHRSVSVHVLRGPPKPEEHRNMPLLTAFSHIQKCYYDLKKKEIGPIPDGIKALLKYLLEDRGVNDSELSQVIAYLQDRRKRQLAFENRSPYDAQKQIYTQEELQRKIFSIISGYDSGESAKADRLAAHNPMNPLSRP